MKKIDISNYDDFIDAGFKECPKCGWAFDPQYFDDHKCDELGKDGDALPTPNKKSPEGD